MGKSSRSKKKSAPPATPTPRREADIPTTQDGQAIGADNQGPSRENATPEDFSHPAAIPWPPPPAAKVTIVPPQPNQFLAANLKAAALSAPPPAPPMSRPPPSPPHVSVTVAAPIARGSLKSLAINAHNRINPDQIVAYRLDRSDSVIMVGADGAQYVARGEYAHAIRNALEV